MHNTVSGNIDWQVLIEYSVRCTSIGENMSAFRQNKNKISDSAASIAGLLVIVLMLSQLVIVILRYLFAIGVSWGLDLLSYLFMMASLLPLFQVVLDNLNVRVDVFYQDYPIKKKSLLDRAGLLILLLPICTYTAYVSWSPLVNSWQLLEASPTLGGLPGYFLLKTLQLICFAGLALIAALLVTKHEPWEYNPSIDSENEPP